MVIASSGIDRDPRPIGVILRGGSTYAIRKSEAPDTFILTKLNPEIRRLQGALGTRHYEVVKEKMAFTEIEIQKITKLVGELCRKRSPEHIREDLRCEYKIQHQDVIIFEVRPRWDNPSEETWTPCAKLKFIRSKNHWRLFWQRADMKWHKYGPIDSSQNLAKLLTEVDTDMHGCFFG